MSEVLTQEQELRVAALREANYYFGFVAALKRPAALEDGAPLVRAREVLAMADVFEQFLAEGTMPEVNGG